MEKTNWVTLLDAWRKENDDRSVVYEHNTRPKFSGGVEHRFTVTVSVRNSLGKPKKEGGFYCDRQHDAQQMVAKAMLERLQAAAEARNKCKKTTEAEAAKVEEAEKVKEAAKVKEIKLEETAEIDDNAVIAKEGKKEQGKEGEQGKEDEEIDFVFDMSSDFKNQDRKEGKKQSSAKKDEKTTMATLEQSVLLQPWQQISSRLVVDRLICEQTRFSLHSSTSYNNFTLTINSPAISRAVEANIGSRSCKSYEACCTAFFSTQTDYTKCQVLKSDEFYSDLYGYGFDRKKMAKSVRFNVTVDRPLHSSTHSSRDSLQSVGIAGRTKDGSFVEWSFSVDKDHYNNLSTLVMSRLASQISNLPPSTIVSFCILPPK